MIGATEVAVRSALNLLVARIASAVPRPLYSNRVRVIEIVDRVAWETGLKAGDITSACRAAHIARARFAVIWLARELTRCSLRQIGAVLHRDPSTVSDAARRGAGLRATDPAFRLMTNRILTHFRDLQED